MNVKGVLLFTLNLITISLSDSKQDAIYQTETASEIATFSYEKDCPSLFKMIRDNNVANYSISCTNTMMNSRKISEKVVLEYACFLSENIVQYLCRNNEPVPKEYLNLDVGNKTSICPMDFTQLRKIAVIPQNKIEQELTSKEHCEKVCKDLYELRSQCIVLSKLNDFIKIGSSEGGKTEVEAKEVSLTESNVPVSSTKSQITREIVNEEKKIVTENDTKKVDITKTEINATVKSVKPIVNKETKDNKFTVQENEKITPKENEEKEESLRPMENTSQQETKATDSGFSTSSKDFIPNLNNEDIKPPRKDQMDDNLEEDDGLDDSIRSDINPEGEPVDEESKMTEEKQQTLGESSIQNEVYSGEGFFQAEDSHFFFYFLTISTFIVIAYLVFHNKNKILAYALEGSSGRRNRRRPNPARYRKLESNLEEAMSGNVSQSAASTVVY